MTKKIIIQFGGSIKLYYESIFSPLSQGPELAFKIFKYIWENRERIISQTDSLIGLNSIIPEGADIILEYTQWQNKEYFFFEKSLPNRYRVEIDKTVSDLTATEYQKFVNMYIECKEKKHLNYLSEFFSLLKQPSLFQIPKSLESLHFRFDSQFTSAKSKILMTGNEFETLTFLTDLIFCNVINHNLSDYSLVESRVCYLYSETASRETVIRIITQGGVLKRLKTFVFKVINKIKKSINHGKKDNQSDKIKEQQ